MNHEFIRRVIPKKKDITPYTQDHIDLMMSHINSYARLELKNKTPSAVFAFYYGKSLLKKLNICFIEPADIILKPALLDKKNSDGQ